MSTGMSSQEAQSNLGCKVDEFKMLVSKVLKTHFNVYQYILKCFCLNGGQRSSASLPRQSSRTATDYSYTMYQQKKYAAKLRRNTLPWWTRPSA